MHTMTIALDGGLKSNLDWRQAKESALSHIKEGRQILWELQLGLFDRLVYPFSHQSQFLSLSLSIDHFKAEIWSSFSASSKGVSLYTGPADYRYSFPWDEIQYHNMREWLREAFPAVAVLGQEIGMELKSFTDITPALLKTSSPGRRLLSLFCRDACVEYLNLLAANISDEIPLFAKLSCSDIEDPAFLAQLTTAEKYQRLGRILSRDPTSADAKVAICLPPCRMVSSVAIAGLTAAMQVLEARSIPYKIIPEAFLITEWDELDSLLVCPKGLGSQGLRKLQGFCAAGGQIVTVGNERLGLPEERSFDEWVKNYFNLMSNNEPILHL